jgi:hypothetical protein
LIGMPLAGAPADAASVHDEYLTGQSLFAGQIELHGRIYTHTADLPPTVVRCANCHSVAAGEDIPGSLAPRLTRDVLLRPRTRRGGPASFYDRDRFCTLLRRGVDPASVLISVEMPRYAIDDASCHALWRYVTGDADDPRAR